MVSHNIVVLILEMDPLFRRNLLNFHSQNMLIAAGKKIHYGKILFFNFFLPPFTNYMSSYCAFTYITTQRRL